MIWQAAVTASWRYGTGINWETAPSALNTIELPPNRQSRMAPRVVVFRDMSGRGTPTDGAPTNGALMWNLNHIEDPKLMSYHRHVNNTH